MYPCYDASNPKFGIIYDFVTDTDRSKTVEKFKKIIDDNKNEKEFFLITLANFQLEYWKKHIEDAGFKEIHEFENPNTDNDVYIYMRIN